MDYKGVYNQLIKSRKISKTEAFHFEKHHVIPKCLGGDNSKDNLVDLTPKEHYIAHLLLYKIYPNDVSILRAFCLMSARFKINSRIYNDARIKRNATMPKKEGHSCWGIKRPDSAKRMTESNPMKNDRAKKIVSDKLTGRKLPEFVKAKMKGRFIGNLNIRYTGVISYNIFTGERFEMGLSETAKHHCVHRELIKSRVDGSVNNLRKLKDWNFTYANP